MPLQIGDHIRIRQPEEARKTSNATFEILAMPNNSPGMGDVWWEMRGDEDGLVYILTTLIVFTIEPV